MTQEEREKEALRLYNLGEITEDEYYDELYSDDEFTQEYKTKKGDYLSKTNPIDLSELPW